MNGCEANRPTPVGMMTLTPDKVASSSTDATLARDEFCARFKARMLAVAGPTFDDGESIADYADQAGPTYFETDWQRVEGPEACADADMSYWGE